MPAAHALNVPMSREEGDKVRELARRLGGVPVAEIMRLAARALVNVGKRLPASATVRDLEAAVAVLEPLRDVGAVRPPGDVTRQRVLAAWRVALVAGAGDAPRLVDVAARAGVSRQLAAYHLDALERDGHLRRARRQERAVTAR